MTSYKADVVKRLLVLLLSESSVGGDIDDLADHFHNYVNAMAKEAQVVIDLAVGTLDGTALRLKSKYFSDLEPGEARQVVDNMMGGFLTEELLSLVLRACWLVIYSSREGQKAVGFCPPTGDVQVTAPATPDLDREFDVCVVGSGAGGSLVAAKIRRANPGASVLLVEAGPFVSPHALPKDDSEVLRSFYKDAGVQAATAAPPLPLPAVLTVLQAQVLGGGPLLNNAIHFPMKRDVFSSWGLPKEITYERLLALYATLRAELGFNRDWPDHSSGWQALGWRSEWFRTAATAQGLGVETFELCITKKCEGCGGCNCGCTYGAKTAGIHSASPGASPRSYLQEYVDRGGEIVTDFSVDHLEMSGRRAAAVSGTWGAKGGKRLRAKKIVIAAGCVATSRLLLKSGFSSAHIGKNMAANIVLPVFAVADSVSPDWKAWKDPGIEMCFFVEPDSRKLLETWFHWPGSLAAALPPHLDSHSSIMNQYGKLACCGVVVPSKANGSCTRTSIHVPVGSAEIQLFLDGVEQIAKIYFAGGAVAIYPGTARPYSLRRDSFLQGMKKLRNEIKSAKDLALSTSHPQGGNAIGESADKGVVDKDLRLFDADNVWLADASVFPCRLRQEPATDRNGASAPRGG